MIELDIAQAATIGTRAEQQDAAAAIKIGSDDGAALVVLADGLGGHADGALAARIVVDTLDEAAKGGQFDDPDGRRQSLHDVILEVNRRIRDASNPADGCRGMGSTGVAAILAGSTVRWISVGDSHLYVWRGSRLSKLNADHSQAGFMVRQGHAPDDEAVLDARSVLLSALTGRQIEEIDAPDYDVLLTAGDVVLLASDGLNTLGDTEIAEIIGRQCQMGAEAVATELIAGVTTKGHRRQDNATVIVARVLSTARVQEGAPNPARQLPRQPVASAPLGAREGRTLRLDDLPDRLGVQRHPGRWWKAAVTIALGVLIASVIVTQTNCCGMP